jgi:predicted glutamine amidotransferase
MSVAFAVYTSDPNLLGCELARLGPEVSLGERAGLAAVGVGWYADDQVLMQRFPANARPDQVTELGRPESEALLFHAGPLPVGTSLEENTQPFRYRHWLFVQVGALAGHDRFRSRLVSALPPHLVRWVKLGTSAETAFALYLSHLRELGRTEDRALDAKEAGAMLVRTAQALQQRAAEVGEGRPLDAAFFATNSRVLVAARLGKAPVYYRLLEGAPTCEVCKLESTSETLPLVRAHLRRRTVAVATQLRSTQGWIELPAETVLAVGRNLSVERLPIGG